MNIVKFLNQKIKYKMSINSKEEANKYYQIVNELVDDYIDKWKIRPSNLKRYLNPGSKRFNKFLTKHNLSELKGVDRILKDIIDDRVSMEEDGVYTFESFKILESNQFKIGSMRECLYKGIEKANLNDEKVLADYFDTNLGSINVIDSDKHIFQIEDWIGGNIEVIIYNSEDLEVIKVNLIEQIYDELSSKVVNITDAIDIELSNLINYESYFREMENKFNEDFTIKIITECLDNSFKYEKRVEHNTDIYFIWSKIIM
jgi:hypothetical protein